MWTRVFKGNLTLHSMTMASGKRNGLAALSQKAQLTTFTPAICNVPTAPLKLLLRTQALTPNLLHFTRACANAPLAALKDKPTQR
jgi:hypothetical protein